jgi:type II secretory pathway pseudopilin PulG
MKNIKKLKENLQNGDTIVEVLIAIAIAAFAIGLSYATAQRSLQQSITAREHNEALNVMENQIADLKLRFQGTDPTTFTNNFANKKHFCLDDSSKGPSDSTTNQQWAIYQNWDNSGFTVNSPLATSTGPDQSHPYYYNSSTKQGCQHGTDVLYYTDITTSNSSATSDSTLYHITVRWEKIGGGPVNQAGLDYKLNGSFVRTLAAQTQNPPSGGILPSCPLPSPNPISETDPVLKLLSSAPTNQSWTYKYTDQPYTNLGNATPWKPNPACTYTISITTRIRAPIPSPPQNNEQLFIQFCNTPTNCEYNSPLTPDINEPTFLSATTNPTFSHVFSGNDINYLKIEHCSIYPGGPSGCNTALNRIDAYDITVTGS